MMAYFSIAGSATFCKPVDEWMPWKFDTNESDQQAVVM